jgi:hypothetical protein
MMFENILVGHEFRLIYFLLCHRDAFLLQVGRNASKVVEASRSKAVSSQSDASNSMQTSSQPSVQASSFQDGTTKGRKIWKY